MRGKEDEMKVEEVRGKDKVKGKGKEDELKVDNVRGKDEVKVEEVRG